MGELLKTFSNPDTIATLSLGEKVIVSLYVTLLGMGITFLSLVFLMLSTTLQSYVMRKPAKKPNINVVEEIKQEIAAPEQTVQADDDEETIAVIMAAISAMSKSTKRTLVVRNIVRTADNTSIWNREGLVSQINSRL